MPNRPDSAGPLGGGPTFHVLARPPLRPSALLLASVLAAGVLYAVAAGLGHHRARRFHDHGGGSAERTPAGAGGGSSSTHSEKDDKDDDPNQVDTVVLGDAADAPVPARRDGHVTPVHATVIVHLPRYGEQTGLIPDSPAGHLLYRWLAAFNQASETDMEAALPSAATVPASTAQMILRIQTGGLLLLSAKEVQPGVLVFRMRDQTPSANEVLGTLQMRAGSNPAAVASFSLRAVPAPASAAVQPSTSDAHLHGP